MKRKKVLSVLMTFVLMLVLSACGESQGVDINMDDVKNVLVNVSGHLITIGIALVVMIVIIILAGKLKKPLKSLVRKSSVIAFLLVLCLCLNLILLGPVYSLVNLAFGEKISLPDELKTAGASLTEEIANEGIVLLKNNNLLPLGSDTKKLNVFTAVRVREQWILPTLLLCWKASKAADLKQTLNFPNSIPITTSDGRSQAGQA